MGEKKLKILIVVRQRNARMQITAYFFAIINLYSEKIAQISLVLLLLPNLKLIRTDSYIVYLRN